jgi:hypothetical protein
MTFGVVIGVTAALTVALYMGKVVALLRRSQAFTAAYCIAYILLLVIMLWC